MNKNIDLATAESTFGPLKELKINVEEHLRRMATVFNMYHLHGAFFAADLCKDDEIRKMIKEKAMERLKQKQIEHGWYRDL